MHYYLLCTALTFSLRMFAKIASANRAAYHGGSFTGVDLRKIMNKLDVLFAKGSGDICDFLLKRVLDEEIKFEIHQILR